MRIRDVIRLARPSSAMLLAAALLLGACASDTTRGPDDGTSAQTEPADDEPTDDAGAEEGPDGNGAPTASPPVPEAVPDTPAGAQLAWILDAIHPDGARPTPGQVADRLAAPLNGMITPGQLLDGFDDLRERGPWDVTNEPAQGVQLTAELRNAHDNETVLINLSVGDDGKLVGLFVAGDE